MYDIIGDVHGYADKLHQLLEKMGYELQAGVFSHPSRKVVFVGDWIDRGPQIRETLAIVRPMIDQGQALAVMGNHEFNALTFAMENPKGGHLRQHTIKNIHQHYQTLYQFREHPHEWADYLVWFLSIPLFLDLADIRVVHTSWDNTTISLLNTLLVDGRLTPELIHQAMIRPGVFWKTVEETLKGVESQLPHNQSFIDKDGHVRYESRVRWWITPTPTTTYADYFFDAPDAIASLPVDYSRYSMGTAIITNDKKPLFFGHYWLQGTPQLVSQQAACVDFSVAKGGVLTAYRWQGEKTLTNEHFIWL